MIHPDLNIPLEALAEFCRRNHIKLLSLFGSATRDDFGPESDVDFLVEFEPGANVSLFDLSRMRRELSILLNNRPVDLVTPSVLRNPYRRRSILRDLQRIYGT